MQWWVMRKQVKGRAAVIVEEYQQVAFEDVGEGPTPANFTVGSLGKKARVKACQVKAIQEVRAQIGWVSDSPANRLVVGRLIRERMKDSGMRPLHISQWSPVAIELFFAPTEEDVLAMEVRKEVLRDRRRNGITNAVH